MVTNSDVIKLARQKRPRAQKRPEEALQRQCVEWLRWALPPPPEGPAWTFVNNGMKRTKAEAGIAKAMGQRAGWPDINLIWRGNFIALEVKAPGRAAKPDKGAQEECQNDIKAAGGVVYNSNSFEHFQDIIRDLAIVYKCRLRA